MHKTLVLTFFSIIFLVQNSYAKVPIAGDPAPNFSLTSVAGNKISLSDLKGKTVLVGMFHICVPCMKQALEFNKVRDQLSSEKLTILGINTSGDSKASPFCLLGRRSLCDLKSCQFLYFGTVVMTLLYS